MLSNENLYIALARGAFRNYIRACIQKFYDFRIWWCRSLDDMPRKLDHNGSDVTVNDSDDDSILGEHRIEENKQTALKKLFRSNIRQTKAR